MSHTKASSSPGLPHCSTMDFPKPYLTLSGWVFVWSQEEGKADFNYPILQVRILRFREVVTFPRSRHWLHCQSQA